MKSKSVIKKQIEKHLKQITPEATKIVNDFQMTKPKSVEEILRDNFGCRNAFCPNCKIRDIEKCPQIKQAKHDLCQLLLEGLPKKKERTKENLMIKIVEFENASKADGWFDGYNESHYDHQQAIKRMMGEEK